MVYDIGKIDLSIYQVVTENIQTDEVIITDERMKHIQEHHPGDFEKYRKYFSEILQHPDYILQTKKHTAEVLKEIVERGKKCKLILRLQTATDPKGFKNAVITFLHIRDKEWQRLIRNKKILYRRVEER
ncbi:PBECR2 nuclease fold domain-containing protein [Selenomonas sputigena]|nr:PBECR2 nuclease fold domain-containing protein [Selenomonas sputigena]UZD43917.1 PBECR2 nuclease fold domain-containing protein [Selenomonas sputigena]